MNLAEAKISIIKGKKVRFELSDGYGTMEYKFGKVTLNIVNDEGTHTFKGSFEKIQKTFGAIVDAEFELMD